MTHMLISPGRCHVDTKHATDCMLNLFLQIFIQPLFDLESYVYIFDYTAFLQNKKQLLPKP